MEFSIQQGFLHTSQASSQNSSSIMYSDHSSFFPQRSEAYCFVVCTNVLLYLTNGLMQISEQSFPYQGDWKVEIACRGILFYCHFYPQVIISNQCDFQISIWLEKMEKASHFDSISPFYLLLNLTWKCCICKTQSSSHGPPLAKEYHFYKSTLDSLLTLWIISTYIGQSRGLLGLFEMETSNLPDKAPLILLASQLVLNP